jgi:hypothetical protein
VQRRHRLGVCQRCDCRPLWSLIGSGPLETCQHSTHHFFPKFRGGQGVITLVARDLLASL